MAISAIKSIFDETIILDTGESIQIHASETDFMKITVSDGAGNTASFPIDIVVGPRLVRIMQLMENNQIEVKR